MDNEELKNNSMKDFKNILEMNNPELLNDGKISSKKLSKIASK